MCVCVSCECVCVCVCNTHVCAYVWPMFTVCNISPREIGRRVRDALKRARYSLAVAINRLAQSYSMLILAIGLDDQHHSMRGRYAYTLLFKICHTHSAYILLFFRLKASRSKLDLELFEV